MQMFAGKMLMCLHFSESMQLYFTHSQRDVPTYPKLQTVVNIKHISFKTIQNDCFVPYHCRRINRVSCYHRESHHYGNNNWRERAEETAATARRKRWNNKMIENTINNNIKKKMSQFTYGTGAFVANRKWWNLHGVTIPCSSMAHAATFSFDWFRMPRLAFHLVRSPNDSIHIRPRIWFRLETTQSTLQFSTLLSQLLLENHIWIVFIVSYQFLWSYVSLQWQRDGEQKEKWTRARAPKWSCYE